MNFSINFFFFVPLLVSIFPCTIQAPNSNPKTAPSYSFLLNVYSSPPPIHTSVYCLYPFTSFFFYLFSFSFLPGRIFHFARAPLPPKVTAPEATIPQGRYRFQIHQSSKPPPPPIHTHTHNGAHYCERSLSYVRNRAHSYEHDHVIFTPRIIFKV